MEKANKIKEIREQIEGYQATFSALDELQHALEKHAGKIVNKTFFAKHFSIEDEEWQKYNNGDKRTKYSIQKHPYAGTEYRIYLVRDHHLELQNRETAHILERAKEQLERTEQVLIRYNKELDQLEALDVALVVKDLKAVYNKHKKNIPQYFWDDILGLYEITKLGNK